MQPGKIRAVAVTVLMVGALLSGRPALAPRDLVGPRPAGPLFPPEQAWLLETRERDWWQKPAALVAVLSLRPGDAVADIGAGSGYMIPHLSRAVGPRGRVWAQEIQAGMVWRLKERARRFPNVRVVRGSALDPGLPPASVDVALLLTSYHEMSAPVAVLRALRSAVRPGGRLVIVDFNDFVPGADSPQFPPEERVPEETVVREAARAGWRLVERHDFLPYQYCLVFQHAS